MTSPWLVATLAVAGLALVSSVHCLTMCGPLAAASQARAGSGAGPRYLLGRLASYSVVGLLSGSVGQAVLSTKWARWGEAALAMNSLGAVRFSEGNPKEARRTDQNLAADRRVEEAISLGHRSESLPQVD